MTFQDERRLSYLFFIFISKIEESKIVKLAGTKIGFKKLSVQSPFDEIFFIITFWFERVVLFFEGITGKNSLTVSFLSSTGSTIILKEKSEVKGLVGFRSFAENFTSYVPLSRGVIIKKGYLPLTTVKFPKSMDFSFGESVTSGS